MIVVSTVDGVLCHRLDGEKRNFRPAKDRLLSLSDGQPVTFINNGGNYAYRLFCEEQEAMSERSMVNPYLLPASAGEVRDELENIIKDVMGEPYPLLVSYAWYTEYRDGGIKMGGVVPPEEQENPAWSPDWRLPRTGMLSRVCEMYKVQPESVVVVTSTPDAIKAAREAGMDWIHPLEL